MKKPSARNTPASVHQRLLRQAKASSRPFNEVLQRFAIERFLARFAASAIEDRFVLKGATMFSVWSGEMSRPTMDIDLLGKDDNRPARIAEAIRDVCAVEVDPDGLVFHPGTVTAKRIIEDAEYKGVRVRIRGALGNARLHLQIDIGFGDVLVPGPTRFAFPSLLGFPTFRLNGYSRESLIAEKFQAMIKLGVLNSRMKDFYDIWKLAVSSDFNGGVLAKAVGKTFERRKTAIADIPGVFDPAFRADREKQGQWKGFLRKANLTDAPESFSDVVGVIESFLKPLLESMLGERSVPGQWKAAGPWR